MTRADGQLIGRRYRLTAVIGQGNMGRVWHARDELLDRDIAVKEVFLPAGLSEADSNILRERVMREARSAARLSHPAVVTVHDVIEYHGRPWIVMELVHGRPLDQVIANDGPLSPLAVAEMGQDLLAGLAAAHTADVLHRDVKPSNVLLTRDGKAVLTDFGLATINGDPTLTQAGMVLGSPAFSAPERVHGEVATPASDLWSLGATLYAAVEGEGPYDRRGDIIATIAAISREDPPRPKLAGPLASAIMALLSREPAARPTVAAAMRMLRIAADDLGGVPSRQGPQRRTPRRVRRVAVPLGVACLAALGLSLWALQNKAAPAPTLHASKSLPTTRTTPSAADKPGKPVRHTTPTVSTAPKHTASPSSAPTVVQAAVPTQAPVGQAPAPHTTSPKPSSSPSGPFAVSGSVSCISGNAVVGVYIAAANGAGFSPWTGQGNGATATFWYTLPDRESYSLHVGCGGTSSSWAVATYGVTVSTAVNNFACDDVPGQADYGSCRVS